MRIRVQEAFGLWPEGEPSPDDKPHLRYASVAGWLKAEGLTGFLVNIADPAERDRRMREYGELQRYLFARHLETLSDEEYRDYQAGTHPSQAHRFSARAEPIARQLREVLAGRGYVTEVKVGFYHMDRIVLSAELPQWPSEDEWLTWPRFFRGFEVKYGLASKPPTAGVG